MILGIPYRQLAEEDPHILSTYLAVHDEIERERERAYQRGNDP